MHCTAKVPFEAVFVEHYKPMEMMEEVIAFCDQWEGLAILDGPVGYIVQNLDRMLNYVPCSQVLEVASLYADRGFKHLSA